MRIRTLVKIYAAPDAYFRQRRPKSSNHLVLILPGTVGEILSQITHPTTGVTITTVQFGDLYADIGVNTWEFVDG